MKKGPALALIALLFAVGLAFSADTYQVDTNHSTVGFSAKHLVISTVPGKFKEFSGTIVYDPQDISKSSVTGTIKTASIDTGVSNRDDDLRSANFFDVEKYPEITFKSTKVEKSDDGVMVTGDLTIKGVTKQVKFPATVNGPIKDPWGNSRIGFSFGFEINRLDYGISYNKAMETGGLVVSKEVKIQIDGEAVAKK
ncbi:MAG TPA: YceI family protein [Acidobacteriota bacterium]